MKKKEHCWNCGSEINCLNWKVGKYRCHKCKDEKIEINEELIEDIVNALEYKHRSK